MSAATTIANAFGESANLYTTVLALPNSGPTVPQSQIRRAYYKRALVYHPDKQDAAKLGADEIADAKAKFHAVSVAYSILSNEETRAEYDETGELYDAEQDDAGSGKTGTDQWAEYFRGIFGSVTVSDIDKFEAKYKCSDEEEKDVLKYYAQFKGDLNKMVECVMLSREEDKRRWVEDYIMPAIKNRSVEDYAETVDRTLGGEGGKEHGGGDQEDEMSEDGEADSDETESEISSSEEEEEKKASSPPKKKKGGKKAGKTAKIAPKKKGSSAKKKGGGGGGATDDVLIAAIRGNAVARSGQSFGSMLAGLEERYAGSSSDGKTKRKGMKKGGKMQDDIPDDEFERIRASLGKR